MKLYNISLSLSDLFLLNIIPSRSIHVFTNGKISFFIAAQYSIIIIYMWYIHTTSLSVHLCMESNMEISQKLKIGLPYEPAIPVWGAYLKKMRTGT